MWAKLCHVCDGDIPLGRVGACDTVKGFNAAATCDRFIRQYKCTGQGGVGVLGVLGDLAESPSRSQQLSQLPNPHQLKSIPIQCMSAECLVGARARPLLEAAHLQVFGF